MSNERGITNGMVALPLNLSAATLAALNGALNVGGAAAAAAAPPMALPLADLLAANGGDLQKLDPRQLEALLAAGAAQQQQQQQQQLQPRLAPSPRATALGGGEAGNSRFLQQVLSQHLPQLLQQLHDRIPPAPAAPPAPAPPPASPAGQLGALAKLLSPEQFEALMTAAGAAPHAAAALQPPPPPPPRALSQPLLMGALPLQLAALGQLRGREEDSLALARILLQQQRDQRQQQQRDQRQQQLEAEQQRAQQLARLHLQQLEAASNLAALGGAPLGPPPTYSGGVS